MYLLYFPIIGRKSGAAGLTREGCFRCGEPSKGFKLLSWLVERHGCKRERFGDSSNDAMPLSVSGTYMHTEAVRWGMQPWKHIDMMGHEYETCQLSR
jgi:hypothetical protein